MAKLETTEKFTGITKHESNESAMSEVHAERMKGAGTALERSNSFKKEPAFLDFASPYNTEKAHEKTDKPGDRANGLRKGTEISEDAAQKEGVCHSNKVQQDSHVKHETNATKGLKTGLETTRESYLRQGAGKDNEVVSAAGKKATTH
jgi:hypothetical protein